MSRKIFAHRYKWSHEKRRAKLRKWKKEGRVKLIEVNKDGWLYEVIDEALNNVKIRRG